MMGYTKADMDFFISYCNIAAKKLEDEMGGISIGLLEVSNFLHGLVAEGRI
jgi:hypothetical protein